MSGEDRQTSERPEVPPWAAGTELRHHELNPELSEAEIEIVAGYGRMVEFEDGAWLWQTGDTGAGFFLVLSGEVEIVSQRGADEESIIISHGRGHYGGETITMTGGGALVSGRAKGKTEVIAVETAKLRELIATESELGETLLLSFILRRMRMIAEDLGDVQLYGIAVEPKAAGLRSFLSRHGVPHGFIDTSESETAEAELFALDARPSDLPVVSTSRGVLKGPTIRQLAEHIGLAASIESGIRYDLAVIGAGPAGLAASVYAASEGLKVIVIESCAPGGQAGTSSRIENYLGFPTGISGQALAGRAFIQAHKFGATIATARKLESFTCGAPHKLILDGGDSVEARAIVIASGAIYREPPIKNLDAFAGGGVHYGASYIEAQLCRQKDVVIVGGGNSAGQAAIYLSKFARAVRILIRGESLAASMSSYLIDRIDRSANIEVVPFTEVRNANGNGRLEKLTLIDKRTEETSEMDASQLFVFIGAVPATDFVPDSIKLDMHGFILTGDALGDDALGSAGWPLERRPSPLESSCPGVFAAGDVRSSSVKRVASAVGEGSVCIQAVHGFLREIDA